MIHHPVILVPKLIVLGILIIALIILRDILDPSQCKIAVGVGAIFLLVANIAIWALAAIKSVLSV